MAQKKNDWEINNLSIQNFKSIKEIGLNPSRVNVFIGKPNAGKSNLLESLVFLGTELKGGGERSLSKRDIRYTDVSSLFYDQNYDEPIVIYNNKYTCALKKGGNSFSYDFAKDGAPYSYTINAEGQITGRSNIQRDINISKYHFKEIPHRQSSSILTHLNPDGSNLWDVTRHNSKLKEFAKDFFKEYSLDVLFDKQNNKFDIMRRNEDSYYLIDFSMTPDTFQRMLYYLAAIESNKNAILLLEEPEAQSYPPYIQMLAERIVDDMDNQYFITTHSPFIVEKMLERAGTSDDVKIFVTYFEEYQTKVHELTKGEIDQILDYNVDLFFNMESYQK